MGVGAASAPTALPVCLASESSQDGMTNSDFYLTWGAFSGLGELWGLMEAGGVRGGEVGSAGGCCKVRRSEPVAPVPSS